MSDDSQRSYDLYEKIAPILNNLQAINNNFDSQKKQIQNLTYTVDKLHLQTKNKEMDEKNLQWLYSLQGRENKLAQEIQLNESKKAQIESLKQQELFYQEQRQSLTIDNNKLRQQLLNVQQKNEQLISQSETQLKQSIREVNEQFISRLKQLESQLQMKQRDETNTIVQMQQMNNKMKVLESQKQIFKEECEQFEQQKTWLILMQIANFKVLKSMPQNIQITSSEDEICLLKCCSFVLILMCLKVK